MATCSQEGTDLAAGSTQSDVSEEEQFNLPVVVRAVRTVDGNPRLVLGNVAESELTEKERETVLFHGDVHRLNDSQQLFIMTTQIYSSTAEMRAQRELGIKQLLDAMNRVLLNNYYNDAAELLDTIVLPVPAESRTTREQQQMSRPFRYDGRNSDELRKPKRRQGRDQIPDILPDIRKLFIGDEFEIDVDTLVRTKVVELLHEDEEMTDDMISFIIERWTVLKHEYERETEFLNTLLDLQAATRYTLSNEEMADLIMKAKLGIDRAKNRLNLTDPLKQYRRLSSSSQAETMIDISPSKRLLNLDPSISTNNPLISANNNFIEYFEHNNDELILYSIPMIRDVFNFTQIRRSKGLCTNVERIADLLDVLAKEKPEGILRAGNNEKTVYSFSPLLSDFQLGQIASFNLEGRNWSDMTYFILLPEVFDNISTKPYCLVQTPFKKDHNNVKLVLPMYNGINLDVFETWDSSNDDDTNAENFFRRAIKTFKQLKNTVLKKTN